MREHLSRYDYSLLVIGKILEGVPMKMSRRDCERLLRPAYPFGERKYWPYKAWRKAVRYVLNERAKWGGWSSPDQETADAPLFVGLDAHEKAQSDVAA